MPSRRGVVLILLFWLATIGYVGYRDVWPRLVAGDPPTVGIDLADEATQQVPARWTVYRGDAKAGALATQTVYHPDDATFSFVSKYRDLELRAGPVVVGVSPLETTVRVTQDGRLRGQSLSGTLDVRLAGASLIQASAVVTGEVRGGQLVGHCKLDSAIQTVDRPLDPVPVRAGQVLNPLQPVNRLRGVRPGQRWVVSESDPLGDAIAVLVEQFAKSRNIPLSLGDRKPAEFVAEVRSAAEPLAKKNEVHDCWVIDYRSLDGTAATTWVRVSDGKVLRQEATARGETLRLERED